MVQLGEGLPPSDLDAQFYKDINTDILYQKVDDVWEEKSIFPKVKTYATS